MRGDFCQASVISVNEQGGILLLPRSFQSERVRANNGGKKDQHWYILNETVVENNQ